MYYLGIDLGGTNIAAGVVNEQMELIYKTSIPTESKTGEDNIIGRMAKVAKMAISGAGITEEEILHIGVGSPGLLPCVPGSTAFCIPAWRLSVLQRSRFVTAFFRLPGILSISASRSSAQVS